MSILPFLSKASFDPEITDVLASAFDTAWERIKASGSPLAADDRAAFTRETLARSIIVMAQAGERDKKRLVENALSLLAFDPSRPGPADASGT